MSNHEGRGVRGSLGIGGWGGSGAVPKKGKFLFYFTMSKKLLNTVAIRCESTAVVKNTHFKMCDR